MAPVLNRMNGVVFFTDTCGTRRLADNWADFYSRMAIYTPSAPADPHTATPTTFPRLWPAGDPHDYGTILHDSETYLNDTMCIHLAPLPLGPDTGSIRLINPVLVPQYIGP